MSFHTEEVCLRLPGGIEPLSAYCGCDTRLAAIMTDWHWQQDSGFRFSSGHCAAAPASHKRGRWAAIRQLGKLFAYGR